MTTTTRHTLAPYAIVANGDHGITVHLIQANRAPKPDEAREIAQRTGALAEDTIEVMGLACNEVHVFIDPPATQ